MSRIDLDLIPPPLSVASLISSISKKEGITGSSQLFVEKDTMTPLSDDHILTEDGNWPGASADDHIMFKFTSRPPPPTFIEGTQYKILNCGTGKAVTMYPGQSPGRDLYLFNLSIVQVGIGHKALDVTCSLIDFGHGS